MYNKFGRASTDLIFVCVVPAITRGIAILTDIMVLAITWSNTADVWKMSRELGDRFRPTLSVLILRDGESHVPDTLLRVVSTSKVLMFSRSQARFILRMFLQSQCRGSRLTMLLPRTLFAMNLVMCIIDVIGMTDLDVQPWQFATWVTSS